MNVYRKGMDGAVAVSLALLCLLVLIEIYTRAAWAGAGAIGMLLMFVVIGQRHFRTRERLLLLLAGAITLSAYLLAPDAPHLIRNAMGSAVFLAAFMLLLAMLREAAATSPSVLAVGRYLAEQPPGRRYLAIAGGGHGLGVLLNFGALSLLGPLLQRGARERSSDDEALAAVRERRQLTALNRGFSWFITWSPTTITQATLVTVVAGVDLGRLVPMALAISALVFLFGWLEDRWRWRDLRSQRQAQGLPPVVRSAPFPGYAMFALTGVFVLLGGLSGSLMIGFGVRMVPALMLAAPLVTLLWIALQLRGTERGVLRHRIKDLALRSVPESSPEALTLAIGGYIGLLVAALVPAGAVVGGLRLELLPPIAIYAAVMAVIPLMAQLALHPILLVTFLGSVLSNTPSLGLDPTLLALSLAIGWSLNLTASPFSASSLVMSRVTGISGTTLSWRWNGTFSIGAYLLAAAALLLLGGM